MITKFYFKFKIILLRIFHNVTKYVVPPSGAEVRWSATNLGRVQCLPRRCGYFVCRRCQWRRGRGNVRLPRPFLPGRQPLHQGLAIQVRQADLIRAQSLPTVRLQLGKPIKEVSLKKKKDRRSGLTR